MLSFNIWVYLIFLDCILIFSIVIGIYYFSPKESDKSLNYSTPPITSITRIEPSSPPSPAPLPPQAPTPAPSPVPSPAPTPAPSPAPTSSNTVLIIVCTMIGLVGLFILIRMNRRRQLKERQFMGEMQQKGKQFDDSLPKIIEKFQPLPETEQQILFKRIQNLKGRLSQIHDSELKQNLSKDLEKLTTRLQSPEVIQVQFEMINIQVDAAEKTIQQILEQQQIKQVKNELKNKYVLVQNQFYTILNTFKRSDETDDSEYTIKMRKEIQHLIENGKQYIQKPDRLDSMKLEQIESDLGIFKNLVKELQERIKAYDIQMRIEIGSGKKIKDTLNKKQREKYLQQLSKLSCHDDPEKYNLFLMNTLTEPDIQEQAKQDCEAERIGLNCLDHRHEYDMFLKSVSSNPSRSQRTHNACSRVTTQYQQEKNKQDEIYHMKKSYQKTVKQTKTERQRLKQEEENRRIQSEKQNQLSKKEQQRTITSGETKRLNCVAQPTEYQTYIEKMKQKNYFDVIQHADYQCDMRRAKIAAQQQDTYDKFVAEIESKNMMEEYKKDILNEAKNMRNLYIEYPLTKSVSSQKQSQPKPQEISLPKPPQNIFASALGFLTY